MRAGEELRGGQNFIVGGVIKILKNVFYMFYIDLNDRIFPFPMPLCAYFLSFLTPASFNFTYNFH